MFRFKKNTAAAAGTTYRYQLYKFTPRFDEVLVIATFKPGLVNGFGVPLQRKNPQYEQKYGESK
jgi:hypothetical protein